MKLYVSFEDESALNPEMAGYRAHIINYLEQLLPDDEIIGRAGCTRAESYEAWPPKSVTICRGGPKTWKLSRGALALANSPKLPLQSSWATDDIPVMVIDSDGTDSSAILDYIGEVVEGTRNTTGDTIQMGGLEKWLYFFTGPESRYAGKFGVLVQTPNLEGADFEGFSDPLSTKQEDRGSKNTKLAFIAKTPKLLGYPRPKPRLSSKILSRFLYSMDGARKLFDLLKQADTISVPDPKPFVEYVNSTRVGTREMVSSCYLAKSDRNGNRRSFSSLLRKTTTDYGRLHLEFRMFSSP